MEQREYIQLIYTNFEKTGWGVQSREAQSDEADSLRMAAEEIGRMMEPEDACELVQVIQCQEDRKSSIFMNAAVQEWVSPDNRPNRLVRIFSAREKGREPQWLFAPQFEYLEPERGMAEQLDSQQVFPERSVRLTECAERICFAEDRAALMYRIFQAVYKPGGALVFINKEIDAKDSMNYTASLFPIIYQMMPGWMRGSFSSTSYVREKRLQTRFGFTNESFANGYPLNGTVSRDQIPTELEKEVFDRIASLAWDGNLDDNVFLYRVLKSCELPDQVREKLPQKLPENLLKDLPEEALQALLSFVQRAGQTSYERIIWIYALTYLDTDDLLKRYPEKMQQEMQKNPEFFESWHQDREKDGIRAAKTYEELFVLWKKIDPEKEQKLQDEIERRFYDMGKKMDLVPANPDELRDFWMLIRQIKNRHAKADQPERTGVLEEFCRQVYTNMTGSSALHRVWFYMSYLSVFETCIPDKRKLLEQSSYEEFQKLFQASGALGLDFLDTNVQMDIYDRECGFKLNAFYIYILIRKNMDIVDYLSRLYVADEMRTREFLRFLQRDMEERIEKTELEHRSDYQKIVNLVNQQHRTVYSPKLDMTLIQTEPAPAETKAATKIIIPEEVKTELQEKEETADAVAENCADKETEKDTDHGTEQEEAKKAKESAAHWSGIIEASTVLALVFLVLAMVAQTSPVNSIAAAVILLSLGGGLLISGKLKEKHVALNDVIAVLICGGSFFLILMNLFNLFLR